MGALIGSGPRNSVSLRAAPPVEIQAMDESTRQLLNALSESTRLQLKPIEEGLAEIRTEFREMRTRHQSIETAQALSQDRIKRYEQDLNKGLSAIRKQCADEFEDLEEKIKGRNKFLVPIAGALATITTILIGLFVYWVKT